MKFIEKKWQEVTTAANEMFRNGDLQKALDAYTLALSHAEVLNQNITRCVRQGIPFLQIYTITCNNLSGTYEAMQDIEQAALMLKRSVYYLLHVIDKEACCIEVWAAVSQRAVVTYLHFLKQHRISGLEQESLLKHFQKLSYME